MRSNSFVSELSMPTEPPSPQRETFVGNGCTWLKAYTPQILATPDVAAYEVDAYRCFHFILSLCRERHCH